MGKWTCKYLVASNSSSFSSSLRSISTLTWDSSSWRRKTFVSSACKIKHRENQSITVKDSVQNSSTNCCLRAQVHQHSSIQHHSLALPLPTPFSLTVIHLHPSAHSQKVTGVSWYIMRMFPSPVFSTDSFTPVSFLSAYVQSWQMRGTFVHRKHDKPDRSIKLCFILRDFLLNLILGRVPPFIIVEHNVIFWILLF